jgi:hypothetical protein
MAKNNLAFAAQPEPLAQPGIVEIGNDRLRVTFDIPALARVKIRSERILDIDYRRFAPEGLALQFEYGTRVYNDAIGAIKETDKKEDGTPFYPTRTDFLNEVYAKAQKKLDAYAKGDGGSRRDTSLDPLEREMLQLGFNHFQSQKWTLKRSPSVAGVARFDADFSESKDYGEFKERVQEYVKKFEQIFRRKAQRALEEKAELDAEIKAMAQGMELV